MAVAAACGQGRRGARRRGQRGRSRLLRGQGRRGVVLREELPAAADQHPSGDRHPRQRGYGTRRGGLLSLLRPLRTTPHIHKKGGFGEAIGGRLSILAPLAFHLYRQLFGSAIPEPVVPSMVRPMRGAHQRNLGGYASFARSSARVRARPSGDGSKVTAANSSTPDAASSSRRSETVFSSPMIAASSGPENP